MRKKGKIQPLAFVVAATLAATLLASCQKRPEHVMSESKTVEVLADLRIAEAYADNVPEAGDVMQRRKSLAEAVMASHGVTQEDLDSTLAWYGGNIDGFSQVIEKTDRKINEKRKKILAIESKSPAESASGNLWNLPATSILSPLGATDGWIFSIKHPELDRGDIIEWSMKFSDTSASMDGVIGVEYTDGTSESYIGRLSGIDTPKISLQTDTGKTVRRIYGTMTAREKLQKEFRADSIKLLRLPYDSTRYRYRHQKKYGVPSRRKLTDSNGD